MRSILIGVDGGAGSADAVAFGGALASRRGTLVTVAHAYPWEHLRFVGTTERNRLLRDDSAQILEQACAPLRGLPDLDSRSLPEPSPARALQELAEVMDADLIVVGSSHVGRFGRVLPGSTAERLLHGSPCPIAVVPSGYAAAESHDIRSMACGWDGSPESDTALDAAASIALAASASLRVIRTFEPPASFGYPSALDLDYEAVGDSVHRVAEQALTHPDGAPAGGARGVARGARGLASRVLIAASRAVDLVVLGSRGYGPVRAVLLGGVSGQVVREAACPVIVVPDGGERPEAVLVGEREGTVALDR